MKLSEILGWDKPRELIFKDGETFANIARNEANTALTSCDREIDREALAKIVYGLKSVFKNPNHYSLKEQEKIALNDVETIISTMPQWMKGVKNEAK